MYNCSQALVKPILALTVALIVSTTNAQVGVGLLSDFESGTTDGWGGGSSPTNVADGGPLGSGDGFLQIGNGGQLATFNTGLSGVLDPVVTAIEVDLMRPAGESDLDIRLVLFGPDSGMQADRWTSTVSGVVPGNGGWETYTFSVLEADLTRVRGQRTYSELVADLDRIMIRYDPGTPSSGGAGVSGTLGIDNVTAIGATPLPGDYDGNGSVGPEDYTVWSNAYGSSVTAGEGADGNSDGTIDAADYTVWRDATDTTTTAIPEATSLALLLVASSLLVTSPRRWAVITVGRACSTGRPGSRPPR